MEVYDEEKPIPRDVLLKGVAGVDGLLCLLTDPIDKEVLDAAGLYTVIHFLHLSEFLCCEM